MPNVVFDASSIIGALLKEDSVPERALLLARTHDTICLSGAVETEIRAVSARPKFRRYLAAGRLDLILDLLKAAAVSVESTVPVTDCRDAKDNKYLELALAAGATTIVASDDDLLVLDPWRGIRIVRPLFRQQRAILARSPEPIRHRHGRAGARPGDRSARTAGRRGLMG
jgi:putative PIN family toxin of toxin-antitoxin system